MGKLENAAPERPRGNCYDATCPARDVLDHVFSRWGGLVLGALMGGTKRYSELRFEIDGISEKMLAQTLRALERDGLVERESFPVVPPRVEYALTPLGRECAKRATALRSWIEVNIFDVIAARRAYDRRLGHKLERAASR